MKKLFCITCSMLIAALLVGCSGTQSDSTAATSATTLTTSTANVTEVATTAASTLGGVRYGDYLKEREEMMASKKAEREKAAQQTLVPSATTTATTAPKEPTVLGGTGDMVFENIICNSFSRITALHAGKRNFVIWAYDESGNKELMVNAVGVYGGTAYLGAEGTYTITIDADGPWFLQIEEIEFTEETSFSGSRDFVTDFFTAPGRSWTITHNGERNFIVKHYNQYGDPDLLVNEIGEYTGTVYSEIKQGQEGFFGIEADGEGAVIPQ